MATADNGLRLRQRTPENAGIWLELDDDPCDIGFAGMGGGPGGPFQWGGAHPLAMRLPTPSGKARLVATPT